MALPVAVPHELRTSAFCFGCDLLDAVMTEETVVEEKIKHPGMSLLGVGTQGIVVDLQDGTVKKFTTCSLEHEAAKLILKDYNCCSPPLFPRMYGIEEKDGYYVIHRDIVTMLTDQEKAFLHDLDRSFDWKSWLDVLRLFPQYDRMRYLFDAYRWLMTELTGEGFYTGDLHQNNVGWAKNDLVAFDFGLILYNDNNRQTTKKS